MNEDRLKAPIDTEMLCLAYHMKRLQEFGFDLETVVNAARCWWQVKAEPKIYS